MTEESWSFRPMASAVLRLSPVSMMTSTPIFRRAAMAAALVGRTGSATAAMPKRCPPFAKVDRGLAVFRQLFGGGNALPKGDAHLFHQLPVAGGGNLPRQPSRGLPRPGSVSSR